MSVSSGEETYSMVTSVDEEKTIDLILLDIFLPKMSGVKTIEKIRKFEKENNKEPMPIIGMTAHEPSEDLEKSQEIYDNLKRVGFQDVVSKPIFPPSALINVYKYSIRLTVAPVGFVN